MKKSKILLFVLLTNWQINAQTVPKVPFAPQKAKTEKGLTYIYEGEVFKRSFNFKSINVDNADTTEWKKQFQSALEKNHRISKIYDRKKNIYIAITNFSAKDSLKNVYVIKYNKAGVILWASQLDVDSSAYNFSGVSVKRKTGKVTISATKHTILTPLNMDNILFELNSSGKLVSKETHNFYRANEIHVNNGYDLSQNSVATNKPIDKSKWIYTKVKYDPQGDITEVYTDQQLIQFSHGK